MPHLQIHDLSVQYNSHPALKDINVDIPDGQITVIVGPSGCGKTTLLKSLNRLVELNEDVRVMGRVEIDGVNIYDEKADLLSLRKKVGFLSQRPCPLPFCIYDNVAYGARIHRMNARQIAEVIAFLGCNGKTNAKHDGARHGRKRAETDRLVECCLRLAGLWDEVKDRLRHPAKDLSIGQQQRLALARALAVGPEAILADEPTSALDPLSTQLIEEQFRFLRGSYTIVLVTHILRQAKRIADYVIFMYLGELIEHGPAEKMFSAPDRAETRAYITGVTS